MPQAPALTTEQRRAAYERSLQLRRLRKEVKDRLAVRVWSLREAWELDPVQGMKVIDLLQALPGVGRVKAERLLTQAGIPVRNTVRACGPRQTERLFNLLDR